MFNAPLYSSVFPLLLPVNSERDDNFPPLVDQVKDVIGDRLSLEEKHDMTSTLMGTEAGRLWGVVHFLVYNPQEEGVTVGNNQQWVSHRAMDKVQKGFRSFKQRKDPNSCEVMAYDLMKEAWKPATGELTVEQYNVWRAEYEKHTLIRHVEGTNRSAPSRKM